MRKDEVPNEYLMVQCATCLDWMAIPPDQTEQEMRDMIEAHKVLCKGSGH